MGDLSSLGRTLVGIAGAIVVIASTVIGVRAALGEFDAGYELYAQFERSGQGLDQFSDVRVRGVGIGSVEAIDLADDQTVVVRMRIDPDIQVPVDATAQIESSSVFGPKFVTLGLGPAEETGPYLAAGETIAIERTTPSTGIETMLERIDTLFGDIDGASVASVIRNLADATRDLGPRLGAIVDDVEVLLDVAHANRELLGPFLDDVEVIAKALGDDGDLIVQLAEDLGQVLPPLVEAEDDLVATLDGFQDLSAEAVDLLLANRDLFRDALESAVDGALPALSILAGNPQNLPRLTDAVSAFGGALTEIIRLERPGGLVGAIEFLFTVEPCTIEFPLLCVDTP